MPARTATETTTRREVLKRKRALLDKLPTREAQVLRMRFGIEEPAGAAVGEPPPDTPEGAASRLEVIEEEVLARARGGKPPASPKGRIVRSLKKKS